MTQSSDYLDIGGAGVEEGEDGLQILEAGVREDKVQASLLTVGSTITVCPLLLWGPTNKFVWELLKNVVFC